MPEIVAFNNPEDANSFTAYFEVKRRFAQISGDFMAEERKCRLHFGDNVDSHDFLFGSYITQFSRLPHF